MFRDDGELEMLRLGQHANTEATSPLAHPSTYALLESIMRTTAFQGPRGLDIGPAYRWSTRTGTAELTL